VDNGQSQRKYDAAIRHYGNAAVGDPHESFDAPADFSLFRRKILVGGGLLLGGFATISNAPSGAADASPPDFANQFMEVSSLLIPHKLDRDVGLRLAAALKMKDAAVTAHVSNLIDIAKRKQAEIVEDFFSDVPDGPVKDTALLIISACYIGVIVDAPDAEVFACELALMYQPTIDVMTIPSYAISGPNGWTSEGVPLADMPNF
jgi:fructose 5-dehydrogenase small subunit